MGSLLDMRAETVADTYPEVAILFCTLDNFSSAADDAPRTCARAHDDSVSTR